MNRRNNSALWVVATKRSTEWRGAEGVWIMLAGWAKAGQSILGEAWVITPDGHWSGNQVLQFPLGAASFPRNRPKISRWQWLKTMVKDAKRWVQSGRTYPAEQLMANGTLKPPSLIIERHDMFAGAGRRLAKAAGCPFVLLVDAPVVWEEAQWGVKRGWWGMLIEQQSEIKSLKRADKVVCISPQVKTQLMHMGVAETKILVVSNRVDPQLFHFSNNRQALRTKFGLPAHEQVIIWTGSFRRFHNVPLLIEAFYLAQQQKPTLRLVLVGDGAFRKEAEEQVQENKLSKRVIFTGKISVGEVAEWINAADLGIVGASDKEKFHYSPLKLREYMACGLPVLAPDAGALPSTFKASKAIRFYETLSPKALAKEMLTLFQQPQQLAIMRDNALYESLKEAGWEVELQRLMTNLST